MANINTNDTNNTKLFNDDLFNIPEVSEVSEVSDDSYENINDAIENRYFQDKHVSDYIALLKFQLIDAETNTNKYKSKCGKYRKMFILSIVFMMLFTILCAQLYCIVPCVILAVGIFFTDGKKTLLCWHYIFYITMSLIVMLQLMPLVVGPDSI